MSALIAAFFLRPQKNSPANPLYAILLDADEPYWEIHIDQFIFNFIPEPLHALEDGLWNVLLYASMQAKEYQYDVNNNEPSDIRDQFEEEDIEQNRMDLRADIASSKAQIELYLFDTSLLPDADIQKKCMQDLPILTKLTNKNAYLEERVELFRMQRFVDFLNE